MPSIDFSVPRWLEPPNAAEQARINEATQAAQERAGIMMRRQIGLRRMQAEAAEAQANGTDPVTARQNALINNAHLLFADNPQAVANIVNHEEAAKVRETAQRQLDVYRQNSLERLKTRDAEIERKDKALEELKRNNQINLDNYRSLKNQVEQELRSAAEEGRNLRSQLAQKRLTDQAGVNARFKMETLLQGDTVYTGLANKVKAAQDHLASVQGRRKGTIMGLWKTTQEDEDTAQKAVTQAQKELRDYRSKVAKKFKVDEDDEGDTEDTGTPKPEPAPQAKDTAKPNAASKLPKDLRLGTIIKQGGQQYSYIGGDPNDPDSWAKVVK